MTTPLRPLDIFERLRRGERPDVTRAPSAAPQALPPYLTAPFTIGRAPSRLDDAINRRIARETKLEESSQAAENAMAMVGGVGGRAFQTAGEIRSLARKIMKMLPEIEESGGATLTTAGRRYQGTGYSVGRASRPLGPTGTITQEQIEKVLRGIRAGENVGLWVDKGKLWAEGSQPFQRIEDALQAAKKRKQLAIFNHDTGESIYLNQPEKLGGPNSAAIRDPQTGKVYTGYNHPQVLEQAPSDAVRKRLAREYAKDSEHVGFTTSYGRFLNRAQADAALGETGADRLVAEQLRMRPESENVIKRATRMLGNERGVVGAKFIRPGGDQFLPSELRNVPGGAITDKGFEVDVRRFQNPAQAGEPAARSGVHYLVPGHAPSDESFFRRGGHSVVPYGGEQLIEGRTAFKRPAVIEGVSGGGFGAKAALAKILGHQTAYDLEALLSKESYRGQRGEHFSTIADRAGEILTKFGGDPALADDIARLSFVRQRSGDIPKYLFSPNRFTNAIRENIAAQQVRSRGHDAIISLGRQRRIEGNVGPTVREIFDLRESVYPTPSGEFGVHPEFVPQLKPTAPLLNERGALGTDLGYAPAIMGGTAGGIGGGAAGAVAGSRIGDSDAERRRNAIFGTLGGALGGALGGIRAGIGLEKGLDRLQGIAPEIGGLPVLPARLRGLTGSQSGAVGIRRLTPGAQELHDLLLPAERTFLEGSPQQRAVDILNRQAATAPVADLREGIIAGFPAGGWYRALQEAAQRRFPNVEERARFHRIGADFSPQTAPSVETTQALAVMDALRRGELAPGPSGLVDRDVMKAALRAGGARGTMGSNLDFAGQSAFARDLNPITSLSGPKKISYNANRLDPEAAQYVGVENPDQFVTLDYMGAALERVPQDRFKGARPVRFGERAVPDARYLASAATWRKAAQELGVSSSFGQAAAWHSGKAIMDELGQLANPTQKWAPLENNPIARNVLFGKSVAELPRHQRAKIAANRLRLFGHTDPDPDATIRLAESVAHSIDLPQALQRFPSPSTYFGFPQTPLGPLGPREPDREALARLARNVVSTYFGRFRTP
jgi:hypothetical protein